MGCGQYYFKFNGIIVHWASLSGFVKAFELIDMKTVFNYGSKFIK